MPLVKGLISSTVKSQEQFIQNNSERACPAKCRFLINNKKKDQKNTTYQTKPSGMQRGKNRWDVANPGQC